MIDALLTIPELFQAMFNAGLHDLGSLHVMIIHFPVVLLTLPIFFLIPAFFSSRPRFWLWLSLLILVIATGSLFLAEESGEAAAHAVTQSSHAIGEAIEHHEELAHASLIYFLGVTGIYFLILCFVGLGKECLESSGHKFLVFLVWLALIPGYLLLTQTAHHGAMLVHQYGVHSQFSVPENHKDNSPSKTNDKKIFLEKGLEEITRDHLHDTPH